MRRLLSVMTIVALAFPVLAQDDFGGGQSLSQSEIDSLLGGGGGRGGRGGRGGNNVQSILPDPVVMFTQIKDLLKTQKFPLVKEQEKTLQTLLNDETKAIKTALEVQFPALNPNNQQTQNNQNNQNRGNQQQNNNQPNANILKTDEIALRENSELLIEMRPSLTPEQIALLDKAEKDKAKVCLVMVDGYFFFQNSTNDNARRDRENFKSRPVCTTRDMTTAQRLTPLREVMSKGKKPLTADQETKFVALIDARMPKVEEALRAASINIPNRNQTNNQQNNQTQTAQQQQQQQQQLANNIVNQIFNQLGIQNPNNNNQNNQNAVFQAIQQACANNEPPEKIQELVSQLTSQFNNQGNQPQGRGGDGGGRGGRGGGGGGGNQGFPQQLASQNPQQVCQTIGGNRGGNRGNQNQNVNFNQVSTEIQKRNEVLLDKVVAMLNKDQQGVIKRFKYESIKSRGGVERIRGIMEEEGTPLTAAQIPQIQALFNETNQSLRTWANQLVLQQMQKEPPPVTQNQQNQNFNQQNRNNQQQQQFNQGQPNPLDQYRQNMMGLLLPTVSKQRVQIENAMMNSVMKVLTPSQVASYKINMSMPPLY